MTRHGDLLEATAEEAMEVARLYVRRRRSYDEAVHQVEQESERQRIQKTPLFEVEEPRRTDS